MDGNLSDTSYRPDRLATYYAAEDLYARAVARLDWTEARIQVLAAIDLCPCVGHLSVWTERLADMNSKLKMAGKFSFRRFVSTVWSGSR